MIQIFTVIDDSEKIYGIFRIDFGYIIRVEIYFVFYRGVIHLIYFPGFDPLDSPLGWRRLPFGILRIHEPYSFEANG